MHHRLRALSLFACLPLSACADASGSDGGGDATAGDDANADADAGSGGGTSDVTTSGGATTADAGGSGPDVGAGSSGGETGGGTPSAGAFPQGLAVASPTASLGMPALPPGTTAIARGHDGLAAAREAMAGASLMPGKPYAVKQAELAAMVAGLDCDLVLGPVAYGFNPMCYGPWLDYQNHPDAPMGMATDGQLPSGDLGLWIESDPGGQACASVKLNALVDEVALKVDWGLYLAANLQCTMVVDGVAMPDPGAEVDATAAVAASLGASNPGVTVGRAVVARQDDDAGRSVYRYEIELSVDQGGPTPVAMTSTMVHSADLVDAADYRGRVWSRFDHTGPADESYAYSLAYAQDATGLRYDLQGASYAAGAADPFDADGAMDFGVAFQGGATRAAVALDPSTGSADLVFAWQAGMFDGAARVFNVGIDFDAPDHGVGCGFFGFGPPFDAGGASAGSIDTFICNWAGPGNQHAGEIGWAQKQCMETDASGLFVATESRIAYAPVNDCDSTADPAFAYRDPTQMAYSNAPIARDLVELASDPDYGAWAPPAAP